MRDALFVADPVTGADGFPGCGPFSREETLAVTVPSSIKSEEGMGLPVGAVRDRLAEGSSLVLGIAAADTVES